MVVLGIVLLILTALIPTPPIIYTLGIVLVVVGAVLWVLGSVGHPVLGRRHYW